MNHLLTFAKEVAEKMGKLPIEKKRPFMDLACDMVWDIEHTKLKFESEKQYLGYVADRCREEPLRYAYKTFMRNYHNWLRRQGLE